MSKLKSILVLSLSLILLFICLPHYLSSQSNNNSSVDSYVGRWRWVSNNRDTFTLVIVKANPQVKFSEIQVIGFHSYIEKGLMIESNLNVISDTVSNLSSLGGRIVNGKLNISFQDFTRAKFFTGTISLIKPDCKWAIWSVPFEMEKMELHKNRLFPDGRTVPNNILLEKIE